MKMDKLLPYELMEILVYILDQISIDNLSLVNKGYFNIIKNIQEEISNKFRSKFTFSKCYSILLKHVNNLSISVWVEIIYHLNGNENMAISNINVKESYEYIEYSKKIYNGPLNLVKFSKTYGFSEQCWMINYKYYRLIQIKYYFI